MKKQKIAVIGKQNHLYWDTHVAQAFRQMEHEVFHFQVNTRPWYLQTARGVLKGISGKKLGNVMSDKWHALQLREALETFRPDLVVFTSAFFIPEVYYAVCRELSSKPTVVAWDGDSHVENPANNRYASYIDILYVAGRRLIVQKKSAFSKIEFLSFCANPEVYKNFAQERENRIYFCATGNQDRWDVISSLEGFSVVLKGWNWKNFDHQENSFEVIETTVSLEQLVEDYNRYRVVLNRHQPQFAGGLNMRTFEVPACGAILLTDRREEIEDHFDIGSEILVYESMDHLAELAASVIEHPQDYTQMARRGYERVIRDHTYVNRMGKILSDTRG